jgi:hypothetical protein
MIEHLPSKQKVLSSNSSTTKKERKKKREIQEKEKEFPEANIRNEIFFAKEKSHRQGGGDL